MWKKRSVQGRGVIAKREATSVLTSETSGTVGTIETFGAVLQSLNVEPGTLNGFPYAASIRSRSLSFAGSVTSFETF